MSEKALFVPVLNTFLLFKKDVELCFVQPIGCP